MAHEVEVVEGVAQMAYAGETPWHGLGTQVSNELSPAQMQTKAGLDWTVHEVESYVDFNGDKIPTGQKSLIRSSDNKVLTNVGGAWNPVQNTEAFEFFSEYVLAGDMEMNTAGSLKGGRNVFALAKVNESFSILGEDQVDSYLLFSNPHEYGKAIDIRFTPIRVVCNNTLTFSLNTRSSNFVKLNHRTKFNADMVKEQMGLASEKFAQYKDMAEFLSTKKFSVDALINYYAEVFPYTHKTSEAPSTVEDLSKNAQDAYAVLDTQPGANFGEGTWWQALNSVTYLTDHKMGRNADSRMQSAWFGINQARKIKAVNKAVEYATAS
jgi:phage/plasmid-like protein (TIGR03299 family)|tara:strand:+ start:1972 stop:2940 length:969 start_codon:yes stop_codon:yes gene_type:complete